MNSVVGQKLPQYNKKKQLGFREQPICIATPLSTAESQLFWLNSEKAALAWESKDAEQGEGACQESRCLPGTAM